MELVARHSNQEMSVQMRIAVASEHRGFRIKSEVLQELKEAHFAAFDFGTTSAASCDYCDFGASVAAAVSKGQVDCGVLFGGTGIGMSIIANKFDGVRAALCHDELSAEISRRHYNANIICLSADLLSDQLIFRIINIWLSTLFEGGRHALRVDRIRDIERSSRLRLSMSVSRKTA
jgi:ribose 5-phosphate isomerase B